jgi:hypothetical protein
MGVILTLQQVDKPLQLRLDRLDNLRAQLQEIVFLEEERLREIN